MSVFLSHSATLPCSLCWQLSRPTVEQTASQNISHYEMTVFLRHRATPQSSLCWQLGRPTVEPTASHNISHVREQFFFTLSRAFMTTCMMNIKNKEKPTRQLFLFGKQNLLPNQGHIYRVSVEFYFVILKEF